MVSVAAHQFIHHNFTTSSGGLCSLETLGRRPLEEQERGLHGHPLPCLAEFTFRLSKGTLQSFQYCRAHLLRQDAFPEGILSGEWLPRGRRGPRERQAARSKARRVSCRCRARLWCWGIRQRPPVERDQTLLTSRLQAQVQQRCSRC